MLLASNADDTPISTRPFGDGFINPAASADGSKVAFQSRGALRFKHIATSALT